MLMEREDKLYINNYYYIAITIIVGIIGLYLSVTFDIQIYKIFSSVSFLTWHILFEFISIIFSFIIFINCYHSYIHLHRIRLLILAMSFFIAGTIDFLHTISYKGMPYTFVESSAAMATSYWIIARLIMSLGFIIASVIPIEKRIKVNEIIVLLATLTFNILIFYTVTYRIEILPPLFIEGVGLTKLKIYMEYLIIFLQIGTIFFYLRTYKETHNKYIIIFCCGVIFSIFSEAFFTLYKSVHDTYNLIGHIYKIIAFYLISHSIFKYNVNIPFIELKKAKERIKLYANNLERIVEKRTQEIQKANEKLTNELDYAKYVQQSLLPKNHLIFGDTSYVSQYIPCERLSGDFFGVYEIDEDNIGIYILDVSGHGVPAALITVLGNDYFKNIYENYKDLTDIKPNKVLEDFYYKFNKLDLTDEMYIVVFLGIYKKSTSTLTYSSGGINCFPILIKPDGQYNLLDKSSGFPICRFEKSFDPNYTNAKLKLDKGDKIIFYTDGLIDKNKNGYIDEAQLIEILTKNSHLSNIKLKDMILNFITSKNMKINDDITYVIMEKQ